jgi:hypothetical protein
VTKINNNSIYTEDGNRFNKRDGIKWGSGGYYHSPCRIALDSKWCMTMTYDEADQRNAGIAAELNRKRLANKIRGTRWSSLELDTLEQIQAIIDQDQTKGE